MQPENKEECGNYLLKIYLFFEQKKKKNWLKEYWKLWNEKVLKKN